MSSRLSPGLLPILAVSLTIVLTGCSQPLALFATPTPEPSLTPTATPIPMALIVNGEGIPQVEFEAELARYQQAQAALGRSPSPEAASQAVVESLIISLLLSQGAAQDGYLVDDAALQARIEALEASIGGPQALATWEDTHGYTASDFARSLQREMAAGWMRDRIIAAVPPTAEQVHVRQILLYNEEEAQAVLAQVESGASFSDLAASYDPVTHGELGWFPQGVLFEPAIEAAAFALQAGELSGVVQTEAGYHILQVVERDPARALAPDALLVLQEKALQDWLDQRRNVSIISLGP